MLNYTKAVCISVILLVLTIVMIFWATEDWVSSKKISELDVNYGDSGKSDKKKAGVDYLNSIVVRAKNNLVSKKVESKSLLNRNVTEIYPNIEKTIRAIPVIENIGSAELRDQPEKALDRFMINLGKNGERAFNHTVSGKGCNGMFQIQGSTYRLAVNRYFEASLIKDFDKGTNDHVNSAESAFLICDMIFSSLKPHEKKYYLNNPQELEKFTLASYNYGPERTKKAIRKHGREWTKRINKETRAYLKKYDAIKKFLS
jgi:hypothetical protein